MYKLIYLIGIFSLLFLGCKKESTPQAVIDEGIIKKYIEDNSLDFTRHESGLYYKITEVGAGGNPNYYSYVKVNYTGTFLDGTVFDSGQLDYYQLASLIDGWIIGIPLMKSGGKAIFIIPSGLAYKEYGSTDPVTKENKIPPNEVLIFDITLIDYK